VDCPGLRASTLSLLIQISSLQPYSPEQAWLIPRP
jgi:hypothetical protein